MMNHQEQEFKWDGSQRGAFADFLHALKTTGRVSAGRTVYITDTYLDDATDSFSKRKIALRLRCVAGKYEATLKTRTKLDKGLACRQEITLSLPRVHSQKGALAALQQKGNWEGIDTRGLQVRFVIQNQRVAYQVQYKKCVCEAALDNYLTLAKGHQWRRREIELEKKKGSIRDFKKLIQQISLMTALPAAKISKVAGAEKWIKEKIRIN